VETNWKRKSHLAEVQDLDQRCGQVVTANCRDAIFALSSEPVGPPSTSSTVNVLTGLSAATKSCPGLLRIDGGLA